MPGRGYRANKHTMTGYAPAGDLLQGAPVPNPLMEIRIPGYCGVRFFHSGSIRPDKAAALAMSIPDPTMD